MHTCIIFLSIRTEEKDVQSTIAENYPELDTYIYKSTVSPDSRKFKQINS